MGSLRIVDKEALSLFSHTAHAYRDRLWDAWLIAPWLSFGNERSALALLVETFSMSRATLSVVTREPEHDWHSKAVALLATLPNCTICMCPTLHAKLYLLRCGGFRYALLGSPNFTAAGDRVNREIAIEIRTSYDRHGDSEASAITELEYYAGALRREDAVTVFPQGVD